jgi:hypothetical protein
MCVKAKFAMLLVSALIVIVRGQELTFPIVGTAVTEFYNDEGKINEPSAGEPFYGQDGHYIKNVPSYTDNNNGTVTDNITGLIWQADMGEKISFDDGKIKADTLTLGGHTDWRVPTIKELYSLILFTGRASGTNVYYKFIDTTVFDQPLGDPRPIDAQTFTSTEYVSTTMNGNATVFGVNFLDGRIKGYPKNKTWYFRMVRGNTAYGKNDFINNSDGTITDKATGLMWQQADDGTARDWEEALAYAESLELAGHTNWRLPSIKELQGIVDYTRAPDITNSPAIDPLFTCTEINDPDGNPGQYPYYWSGTTHLDGPNPGANATYVAFGEAQGKMNNTLMDVHGAGAQRSDPKSGDPDDYPQYVGPQGDVRLVYNYVRCVRTAFTSPIKNSGASIQRKSFSAKIIGNKLMIDLPLYQKFLQVNIYQINGKKVASYNNNRITPAQKMSFTMPTILSTGVYIISLKNNSISISQQIIIQ